MSGGGTAGSGISVNNTTGSMAGSGIAGGKPTGGRPISVRTTAACIYIIKGACGVRAVSP